MNKFVVNVDEKDPDFIAHVAKRVELARDPRNQITLDELKRRVNKKLEDLRKNESVFNSI